MINLLGRDIDLLILPANDFKIEAELLDCWEDGLQGFFNQKTFQVLINGSLSRDQRKRVIIHELCHALFHTSGLDYLVSDKQEDAVCSLIENLYPLIKEFE